MPDTSNTANTGDDAAAKVAASTAATAVAAATAEATAEKPAPHKVKVRKPKQRSCDERDAKGKICAGHLKHWYDYPRDVEARGA